MENKDNRDILQRMAEGSNKIIYNPAAFNLTDVRASFEAMQKHDQERRERLDKEYTPIEKITLKEIEDLGDNIPISLMVKVKIGGWYNDIPVLVLKNMLLALQAECKKFNDGQK